MPATLHSLPPEIRQVIFRHLFQGNVIKVKLRLTHRAPAGRKVNKSWKGCASKHRLETEVPDILLACKIFYEEGLKVFYQQSTLHLDNLNVQDPRSDKCCAMSWTRSYLEASAPRVCLEQVSQMIVVGGWESNAQQMVEAMPSLREVELPEVWVDKITKEWKLFSNTVMIQELEMEAFYPERYWEIAARLPHISFKGHILIKDEDREAGEVSENIFLYVDYSARSIITRDTRVQRYRNAHSLWTDCLKPKVWEGVVDLTGDDDEEVEDPGDDEEVEAPGDDEELKHSDDGDDDPDMDSECEWENEEKDYSASVIRMVIWPWNDRRNIRLISQRTAAMSCIA